jgi:CheY-like chemotaxis protein
MPQRVDVLVVDDRAADADITLFAIRCASPHAKALWLNSGNLALQFLLGSGRRALHSQTPRLILISQGMKGLNGAAVCDLIRCHPATARLPIVLMRRGDEPSLASAGKHFDPDASFQRSTDPDEFLRQVDMLAARWLRNFRAAQPSTSGQDHKDIHGRLPTVKR